MTRACACPCGRSLEGRRPSARYYEPACRAVAYRNRHGIVPVTAREKRSHAPPGRSGPSGVQVSYRRAVSAIALALAAEEIHVFGETGTDLTVYRFAAELMLAPALSDRQRERLEQIEANRT